MKRAGVFLWLAGISLLVGLVAWQGASEVWATIRGAGWGVLAVCSFYPLALLVDTECWRLLLPRGSRPRFAALLAPRWICDAVNGLLPSAQVGGDVVRARLLAMRGIKGADAGASVVADITAGVVTEILFTLLGVGFLLRHGGSGRTIFAAIAGVGIFTLLAVAFYMAQHGGLFRKATRMLERIVRIGEGGSLAGSAEALDAALVETYRRRAEFAAACAWRMAGWFAGALEVWIALWFLGKPVGVVDAVMLESLGQAVRHAVFLVPGALGVQEGGFILLGGAAGLGPETGLALSLMKRVRELILGLPGLLLWQVLEGRRAFRRGRAA